MSTPLTYQLSPEQERQRKIDWRKHLAANPGLDWMLDVAASPGCSNIPLIERALHEVELWNRNWLEDHGVFQALTALQAGR